MYVVVGVEIVWLFKICCMYQDRLCFWKFITCIKIVWLFKICCMYQDRLYFGNLLYVLR